MPFTVGGLGGESLAFLLLPPDFKNTVVIHPGSLELGAVFCHNVLVVFIGWHS